MASNRIERINEEIQRELAELLRNVKDPRVNQGMLSITRVETTGDLKNSKVYYSVYGSVDEKELRRGLRSSAGYLRRELSRKLNLRATPELAFERDSSIEHGAHIISLINELGIQGDEDEDSSDQ